MNKNFILLDKTSNAQKLANTIIKFSYENKDYLIYSIDENEQNKQIFTSRLIFNSEGKCFTENLSPEEKNKLNNIVYNIVILIPTEYKKGNDAKSLIDSLSAKFSIKLSKNVPELEIQEYYSNCSIAITSKELVQTAQEFYESHLEENVSSGEKLIPTWTLPTEMLSPIVEVKEERQIMPGEAPTIKSNEAAGPISQNNQNITNGSTILNQNTLTPNIENIQKEEVTRIVANEMPTVNVNEPVATTILPNNTLNNQNIVGSPILTSNTPAPDIENNQKEEVTPIVANEMPTVNINEPVATTILPSNTLDNQKEEVIMPINNINEENLPNPQKEKLAVVSDPSLSNFGIDPRGIQPNMQNVKKAGFAVNKHIIIGTICLILAVGVVIGAYFLIKNMK